MPKTARATNMLKSTNNIRNPKQSFLVRAPAGSGKTTCLIERLIALIASGQDPSSILLITFTNKAVDEMKVRVQSYFSDQYRQYAPTHLHELIEKSQHVLKSQKLNLNDVIEQIQIQTIDALAQSIIQIDPCQMPRTMQIHPNPEILYRQACDRLFNDLLIKSNGHDQALNNLILELDNQVAKTKKQLIKLLACRDQWLPKIFATSHNRENKILSHLKIFWQIILNNLTSSLSHPAHKMLLPILSYIHPDLNLSNEQTNIDDSAIDCFKSIAYTLLTSQGKLRKRLTTAQGLAPASSEKDPAKKQLLTNLHQAFKDWCLSDDPHKAYLLHILQIVMHVPKLATYQSNSTLTNWMSEILPMVVAHLQVTFQEHQHYDFIECTQLAIDQLSDPHSQASSFYELNLKHLLVDEFQDTSDTHYRLIYLLTKHFSFTPDCSIFLVGDPMQSIYRFRQADVRLFLQLEQQKKFHLPLNIHYLNDNYRSTDGLVRWTNQFFSAIHPSAFDDLGAVPFHPSTSQTNHQGQLPTLYTFRKPEHRVALIAQQITTYQSNTDGKKIGVLVRKRKQVMEVQNSLQSLGIDTTSPMKYQFQEIEDVCIIHHLVGTLLNPYDANHACGWLASKWLQIPIQYLAKPLKDQLHVSQIILSAIQHIKHRSMQKHLKSILDALQIALDDLYSSYLTEILITLLKAIRPSCVANPAITAYIQCWQNHKEHPAIAFDQILTQTYVPYPAAQNLPEVMTIHQAKGLEFDHVILPYIESSSSQPSSNLLLWHDFYHQGQAHALFAINSQRFDAPEWMKWISYMEKQKDQFENLRVHYVAITRAKQTLDLILYSQSSDPYLAKVDNHSLMDYIQRYQLPTHQVAYLPPNIFKKNKHVHGTITLESVSKNNITDPKKNLYKKADRFGQQSFDTWFGLAAHYYLELFVHYREQDLSMHTLIKNTQQWLEKQGCQTSQSIIKELLPTLTKALKTNELQWILSPHFHEKTEWQIFQQSTHDPGLSVIDRAFFDPLGTFWIIDYKTSKTLSSKLQANFLNQLTSYHKRVSQLYPDCQIYLGIYNLRQHAFLVYDANGQEIEKTIYQKHIAPPLKSLISQMKS
jgi:ATP-dependent exoDNAse (exonuclease V) beta subunit